jgi:hypothetical protein
MDTLYNLMNEIETIVPEVKHNHNEVTALIKQHIHDEKHDTWFMFGLYFLRPERYKSRKFLDKILLYFGLIKIKQADMFYNSVKEFADIKLLTHSRAEWGDYNRNLEWVKQYHSLKDVK